jgi:hypothetical protein
LQNKFTNISVNPCKFDFLFIRQYVKFSPVMRLTRYLQPLLLVFVLLLAQQGSVVHAVHHVVEEQTQDHSLPHDKLCEMCAVYAQIGSAIGSSLVFFTPIDQVVAFVASSFSKSHIPSFTAFAARAPPYPV